MPDPTPRRCDGCGRGLAVYTVPPGQAPRGVTYVCLDCADRSKPSVSVAPPPTILTPEIRRWDWTGAKAPPSAEEQAAAVQAMMAIPFDELGYLRAKLAETTEIALRLEAERDEARRVCDRPGCDAVVVRLDDGSRRCGAGHDSRWVERADIMGSRLLFSQRAALDRAGAPTAGEGGAPVSDGWRATWAAEELIRVRTERDELRGRIPVTIEMDTDSLRSEINRLILEHLPTAVAPLEAERDALRARVAELEEAARWRAAKDAPNLEPVAIRLRDDVGDTKGTLVEGRRNNRHGEHKWSTPLGMCSDADVLGWRPLGPGPEVAGG